MALGEVDENAHQAEHGPLCFASVSANEERQVGRHLVVARSSGVELAAHRSDDLGEPALDRHVDILVVRRGLEGAGLDLSPYLLQPPHERGAVLVADDLSPSEHPYVRERLLDVVRGEAAVERNG
jgi:hypothetical protein